MHPAERVTREVKRHQVNHVIALRRAVIRAERVHTVFVRIEDVALDLLQRDHADPDVFKVLRTMPDTRWNAVGFHAIHPQTQVIRAECGLPGIFAQVGAAHDCRVIGHSPLDGILNVSLQPSVLKATVLRYDQLRPGLEVVATVTAAEPWGIKVTVGQGVKAVVTAMHLADVPRVRDPAARFKKGKELKCRVLSVDAAARKVQLTHKKSFARSALPAVTSYDCAEGTVAHA